jgi:hypothetical protein
LVDSSHWTVGVGDPDAEAENDAVWPTATDVDVGFATTAGAAVSDVTVKVAGLDVTEPPALLNTAANSKPLSPTGAAKAYVVDVAPEIGAHVAPSVDSSHWTLGVGDPDAAAENDAV